MFQVTSEIYAAFQEAGLKCTVEEGEERCAIKAGISGDHCNYRVYLISRDAESNDFALRVFQLANIPEGKKGAVLSVLNDMHEKFRFFKFVVDEDGDLNVEYDFPKEGGDPGKAAVEMVIRLMQIVDDIYPPVMKVLWS